MRLLHEIPAPEVVREEAAVSSVNKRMKDAHTYPHTHTDTHTHIHPHTHTYAHSWTHTVAAISSSPSTLFSTPLTNSFSTLPVTPSHTHPQYCLLHPLTLKLNIACYTLSHSHSTLFSTPLTNSPSILPVTPSHTHTQHCLVHPSPTHSQYCLLHPLTLTLNIV